MNKVLEGLTFAMTYLDDIITFSNSEEEHLFHLEEVCHLPEEDWTQDGVIKV